jgi:hypothetical protein
MTNTNTQELMELFLFQAVTGQSIEDIEEKDRVQVLQSLKTDYYNEIESLLKEHHNNQEAYILNELQNHPEKLSKVDETLAMNLNKLILEYSEQAIINLSQSI